ncbi:uncharacterized protein BKA55DRAFT_600552 [Fusarium redolens]|uniref:Mitochondrial division protein 1 n=1 Tax=Fusarium redolens TaxID=48865 RepID=A0A9P9FWA6_FUSRE|nr:uncharacterized protein BKA55DRAFT_600552 [Fusarium redolens]KAH7202690.1 hypothetical protein BKA55DRAFT_600552 [Fusarium redolens]
MALEGLGIAANVLGVVDISAKVIDWCVRYAQDVLHAKEDKKRLVDEVTRLNLASVNACELLRGPHGLRLKASYALYLATRQLARGSGQAKIGFEALKWPFKSKDVHLILLDVDHKVAFDTLPIAEGALFDSHAEEYNPIYLPNTRKELLKEIDSWIADPKSKTIFWLNGMAGMGKSTISRTVARLRSKRGDLGASFFFKGGETDRGNLTKFVPTVARRLAWSTPGVAPFIKSAVDADLAIIDKAVREQFEKLVREPLLKAPATSLSRPIAVIVVDALDECEMDADIKLLLELFSSLRFAGSLCVRVLITSRPELPVCLGFSSIGNTHQDLVLHKIPQLIIEHDISVFLRHEFTNICNRFNKVAEEELKLLVHWPGESNLEKLIMAAVPFFIFAATLCRFVNDSYLGSPNELLQSVLYHTSNGYALNLDMTYLLSFCLIISIIIMLASPLSMYALALLLEVYINKVPENLNLLVRLLYLSFREYLVNLENREIVKFWVLTWDSETDDWQGSEGHGGIVRSVVFSHNSIKLASASNDMTARIWDAETGECERVLEGHIDQVNSVVFSHDSTKLASASDESALRIWNVETGICKDIIMLDVYADVLSFMDDERGIVTDHGVFTLTGDLESRTEPPISLQPSEAVTLASRDGTWVKTAGMDLLWLSPECRHGQSYVLKVFFNGHSGDNATVTME